MSEVTSRLEEAGLVPVIAIDDAENAVPLARTFQEAGLPVAEITFRTQAAEEAIRAIAREVPEVLVGAGTVLTVAQVQSALSAGASFIVSPGFNPKVVDYCVENGIPVVPGINNPTGIEMALDRGLSRVKFFPSEASGGLTMLKAMSAPYGNVQFMPTGGVKLHNLGEYLQAPMVFAVGGSWVATKDLIARKDFDEIGNRVREAVAVVKKIRGGGTNV
ncbi:MAG: bifunctional 4-hydroxy-2-oxoglutarate aldolase/2-dehydro-3-deoxy-phosphogluconate aldolase [Spirochaetaceae bacterium]